MSNEEPREAIDTSKLSLAQFVARTPLTQVVSVVVALVGAGYAAGRFHAEIVCAVELQKAELPAVELRARTSQLSQLDRAGPFGEMPREPWTILDKGNKLVVAGEIEKAVMVYKAVESVDRYGTDVNTSAAYDMISKLSAQLAVSPSIAGTERARWMQMDALKYKKASEYAVQCKEGNCKNSKTFWSQ